jgi:(p)ppGpp synthase/HD superfamily hydrolase
VPKLPDALAFALEAHGSQRRKGKDVPYVAHLLGVASLVLELGGTEDQAIAGLLHDTLEDTSATVDDLARFGDDVVRIIVACTDSPGTSAERKARYVAKIPTLPADIALVSACDKLHNLRDMVLDANSGAFDDAWPFNVSRTEQVTYYRSMVASLVQNLGVPVALVDEMQTLVDRLERALL